MSDTPNLPKKDIAHPSKQRLLYVVIALLAALLAVVLLRPDRSAELAKDNAEAHVKLANLQEKLVELETAQALRDQETAARKSQAARIADQAALAEDAVDSLAAEVSAWESSTRDLFAGEEGRRIAADASLLRQFRDLREQPRPNPRIPDQLRARLQGLKAQAQDAGKHPNAPVSPQLGTAIAGIESEAKAALKSYRDHNEQLRALRSQAPKSVPGSTPKLETALSTLKDEEAAARAAIVAKKIMEVREQENAKAAERAAEEERKLRAQQAENERREGELKRERLRLESEQRAQTLAAENRSLIAKKNKAQLEQEFQADLNDIRALLSPFVSDGSTQPEGTTFKRTGTKPTPVSLAALRGAQALDPNDRGQQNLYFMTSQFNDRPLGAFPKYFGGESDWRVKAPAVQRAQELLIKYGEVLVEKGMLIP